MFFCSPHQKLKKHKTPKQQIQNTKTKKTENLTASTSIIVQPANTKASLTLNFPKRLSPKFAPNNLGVLRQASLEKSSWLHVKNNFPSFDEQMIRQISSMRDPKKANNFFDDIKNPTVFARVTNQNAPFF